ncbi:MAG: Loki-CTERM sorting domain-containing protein [Promethearchaeota archaeon]
MKGSVKIQRQRKILSKKLVYLVCFLCVSILVFADTNYSIKHISGTHLDINIRASSTDTPEISWNRIWGGTGVDNANGLALDSSDNIYVVGVTNSTSFSSLSLSQPAQISDIFLLKYDSLGQQQWSRTWGGANDDWGRSLVSDSSDNIYIVGGTKSFGAGGTDIALIKYNSLGVKQWNITWGTSGSDSGYGIALDSLGNIFIAGSIATFNPSPDTSDMVLVKFNSLGEYQWDKTWGGSNIESGWAMKMDSSDNIFITGYTFSYGAGGDLFLLKYNSSGDLQWDTTWGGSSFDDAHTIELDSSGNIFVSGCTLSFGAGSTDFSLIKFNSNGDQLWNKTWGGSESDGGWDTLALDSSENIYLGGGTGSFGPGLSAGVVVKLNSSGDLQWNSTWGGNGENGFSGIVIDSSDNIYVAGFTDSFGSGMNDMVLIKYGESIPDINPAPIPGYNLFFLVGTICVATTIVIKKRYKTSKSKSTNLN